MGIISVFVEHVSREEFAVSLKYRSCVVCVRWLFASWSGTSVHCFKVLWVFFVRITEHGSVQNLGGDFTVEN